MTALQELLANIEKERTPLTAPAAVTTEGNRIRAALPVAPPAVVDPLAPSFTTNAAVDPEASRRYGDSFFHQPSNWDVNFGTNRSPYALRQQLQLDELTTLAAQRKFDLEKSQRQAPLEDRLLQARINAEGAHTDFLKSQDAQVLEHTSGFLRSMAAPNAPGPHDPEYRNYALATLLKNPRFAETPGGKDLLKQLGDTHDTHVSMAEIKKQLPPGYDVSSIRIGPRGQTFVAKDTAVTDKDLEKQLKSGYKLTLGQVRNPVNAEVGTIDPVSKAFKGDPNGNVVRVLNGEGQKVSLSRDEYERFGGKFGGVEASAQAKTAPVDLDALARKALNDPNTSEEIRAAARKHLIGQ